MRRIGLEVARLRHAARHIGEPLSVASVRAAQESRDPELRAAVATLEAAVIRIGLCLDELLVGAFRRNGRPALPELREAWRWALDQDRGVPIDQSAQLEAAAKTARRLARFTDRSAAGLQRATATFDQDMPNVFRLIEAAWSASRRPERHRASSERFGSSDQLDQPGRSGARRMR
jgi:hypothetical protein